MVYPVMTAFEYRPMALDAVCMDKLAVLSHTRNPLVAFMAYGVVTVTGAGSAGSESSRSDKSTLDETGLSRMP
jgi:hypothetical protein